MNRDQLIAAIQIMADTSASEADWLAELRAMGLDEDEARRAIAFVPIGLARPLLERLGVTHFADVASIPLDGGDWLTVRLTDQPEYLVALAAASEHFATGSLPHEAFSAVVLGSSDVVAVSNALDAGEDVTGSAIATAFHDLELAKHVIV